jgi:hypothetical protein
MILQATWQNGHALAQTVFSCLYLLNVERIAPNALLHAFCRSTRATCSMIRTAIALADIHEVLSGVIVNSRGVYVMSFLV